MGNSTAGAAGSTSLVGTTGITGTSYLTIQSTIYQTAGPHRRSLPHKPLPLAQLEDLEDQAQDQVRD